MTDTKCIQDEKKKTYIRMRKDAKTVCRKILIALHRTLLHEHHDFFLASQHPSASTAVLDRIMKYPMPARMWKRGIHSFPGLLLHLEDELITQASPVAGHRGIGSDTSLRSTHRRLELPPSGRQVRHARAGMEARHPLIPRTASTSERLYHMLAFIYIAYHMMAFSQLLYPWLETVPTFEDTWIECLGELVRFRMAV